MKTIYACDICGKQSEECADVYKCEDTHLIPDDMYSSRTHMIFKEGEKFPKQVPIKFVEYNSETQQYDEVWIMYEQKGLNQKLTDEKNAERRKKEIEDAIEAEKRETDRKRMNQELHEAGETILENASYWKVLEQYKAFLKDKALKEEVAV